MVEEDTSRQSSIQVVVRVRPFTHRERLMLQESSVQGPENTVSRASLLDDDLVLLNSNTTKENVENDPNTSLLDQWNQKNAEGPKRVVECVDDKMIILAPLNGSPSAGNHVSGNYMCANNSKGNRDGGSLNNLKFIGLPNEPTLSTQPLSSLNSASRTRNITPRKRKLNISNKEAPANSPQLNFRVNSFNNSVDNLSTSPTLANGRKSSVIESRRTVSPTESRKLAGGAMRKVSSPSPGPRGTAHSTSAYKREHRYIFDRVFDENSTQEEVYEYTTKPLLNSILQGYNCTIFAYGATGCGKTYTINGDPAAELGSPERNSGLVYKVIQDLFTKLSYMEENENKEYELMVSYLEIYNETIKDLLSPQSSKKLVIREDKEQKIQVTNLSYHKPETLEDIMDLIEFGNNYRTTNETNANKTSSRSHSVLQITVVIKNKDLNDDLSENQLSSVLSIIDLAGSERASKTQNRGARLQEGANINKSLLALGNCIKALCSNESIGGGGGGNSSNFSGNGGAAFDSTLSTTGTNDNNNTPHVPYRDSKLTRLLKFSLGGNCKTVMIVCCSPSSEHYEETLNTLAYADRAKEIKTKLVKNSLNMNSHVGSYQKIIERQKLEIQKLKQYNDLSLKNKREQINLKIRELVASVETRLNLSAKFDNYKYKRSLILCKRRYLQILIMNFQQYVKYYGTEALENAQEQVVSTCQYLQSVIGKLNEKIYLLEAQYESEEAMIDSLIDYENMISNLPLSIDSYNEMIDLPIVDSLIKALKDNVLNEILTNSVIMVENLIKDYSDTVMLPMSMINAPSTLDKVQLLSDFEQFVNNIDVNFDKFSARMFENLFGDRSIVNVENEDAFNQSNVIANETSQRKKLRWTDMDVNGINLGLSETKDVDKTSGGENATKFQEDYSMVDQGDGFRDHSIDSDYQILNNPSDNDDDNNGGEDLGNESVIRNENYQDDENTDENDYDLSNQPSFPLKERPKSLVSRKLLP